MLFLRITPSLPNLFINLASPIVDIPFHIFFLATLIGLIPASYITVRVSPSLWPSHFTVIILLLMLYFFLFFLMQNLIDVAVILIALHSFLFFGVLFSFTVITLLWECLICQLDFKSTFKNGHHLWNLLKKILLLHLLIRSFLEVLEKLTWFVFGMR